MKWKLEIEMKLLEKNGIRIEIEFIFKMEITLAESGKKIVNNSQIVPEIMQKFKYLGIVRAWPKTGLSSKTDGHNFVLQYSLVTPLIFGTNPSNQSLDWIKQQRTVEELAHQV